jgi:hypothetical protein
VFTTHSVADLDACDRIVFMTRGGRVGFVGTLQDALERFAVSSVPQLYRRLADLDGAPMPAGTVTPPSAPTDAVHTRPAANGLTQWRTLTQRALDTMVHNRLTLAILLGSPALVVGMFAILFRPGAFDVGHPSPSSMVMIGFWVVFAAFFFGLTYGLLQICTEQTILRRERLVGLRLGAYVASKVTVLVPFLLFVVVACSACCGCSTALPEPLACRRTRLSVSGCCCAHHARSASGCSPSAAVGNVAQATLALPMLCSSRRPLLRSDPAGACHGERGRTR